MAIIKFLKEYYAGFLLLAKKYHHQTRRDLKIYNMYYRKKDNLLIVDKGYSVLDLIKDPRNIRIIANEFKDRANQLAHS